jgi:hypothetical protein
VASRERQPRPRRRSAVDFSTAQLGDLDAGVVADSVYQGIDGATLLRLLEGSAHERDLVAKALEQLRDQLRAHEIMQERRDRIDVEERTARREALDDTLDAIARALTDQADALAELRRGQRLTRFWLVVLTAALLGAVLVVAALVQRELAVLALHTLAFWR